MNRKEIINIMRNVEVENLTNVQKDMVKSILEGKLVEDIAIEKNTSSEKILKIIKKIVKNEIIRNKQISILNINNKTDINMSNFLTNSKHDPILFDNQYLLSYQDVISIIDSARKGEVNVKEISNLLGGVKSLEFNSKTFNKVFEFGKFLPEKLL
jgi:hypothetical protein